LRGGRCKNHNMMFVDHHHVLELSRDTCRNMKVEIENIENDNVEIVYKDIVE
jgi:hypothetical protein